MQQCFSAGFEAAIIHVPQAENIAYSIRDQIPSTQKIASYLFQICVKTYLGHTVPPHEKSC